MDKWAMTSGRSQPVAVPTTCQASSESHMSVVVTLTDEEVAEASRLGDATWAVLKGKSG
jgi:hypothetical protein